ncbi:MAG: hypothetical protein A4E19_12050 [Nitrospira sp. SG-bin1]|nr:MAG: hypothetical protein A4E19_12050 [Nitrospira sp. SG-bin1]
MKLLLVGAIGLVVIILLWRYLTKARRRKTHTLPFAVPSGVTLGPARLLTDEEVALYSLLRMAVQEHYLVFSQVPLWSFVSVEAAGKMRTHILRKIALKRVDFVLVHPGSCRVERVVQIERDSTPSHQDERQSVIESVLEAAGIKLTKLQLKKTHSLPDLTARLGITAEE